MTDENKLLETMVSAAKDLSIDIMLIGAYSRDYWSKRFAVKAKARTTFDIDFACQVSTWQEYQSLSSHLIRKYGFGPDTKEKQKLWSSWGIPIDLLPFGGIVDSAGNIQWPPKNEPTLCVLGYDAAKEDAEPIPIGNEFLPVIKPYWLALLKLQSFIGDPERRQKDLADFGYLLNNYPDFINLNDRLYNDNAIDKDVLEIEDFDYLIASAILIVRDCLRANRDIAIRILESIQDFNSNGDLLRGLIHENHWNETLCTGILTHFLTERL